MTVKRLEIDANEPGFCLTCLGKHAFEEMTEMIKAVPQENPFPGRCLVCRQPVGPLRPVDGLDER